MVLELDRGRGRVVDVDSNGEQVGLSALGLIAKAMRPAGEAGGFGRASVGAAERPLPTFTRAMKSRAEVIARGDKIDKVGVLVEKFGGKAKDWRKMKTWTDDGAEVHWYENPHVGKRGTKWAGFPDPF